MNWEWRIAMAGNRVYLLKTLLVVTALAWGGFLNANDRGSTNYGINVESTDGGGGRLTGGLIRIDSNIGGIAGEVSRSGPEPAAQFTAVNGFFGQLFDITGLAIGLTPATVNEEGTAQLDVAEAFDDDTVIPLDPTDVDWIVQSGPVVSVLETGLLNADTVNLVDTPAVIAAAYKGVDGSLTISVINVDSGITGDGLPDAWQLLFFSQDAENAGPNDDADNDGLSNFYEYAFDFNPIISDSGSGRQPPPGIFTDRVAVNQKTSIHTTVADEQFLALTFRKRPDSAGLDYIVEVASSPTSSAWQAMSILVGAPFGPDGDGLFTVTYRDNVPFSTNNARFIRIRVVKLLPLIIL